uniref:Neural proliferation, differentiation and control 1 n=1 Tax=Cyanistes caeruleus TaxID=156563 RepID=A0A8C0VRW1_CYACU
TGLQPDPSSEQGPGVALVKPIDSWELQQKQPWTAQGGWVPHQEGLNRAGGVFDSSPSPELFCPVPTAASCPRSLDCALQRREFCPPGSGACGPCLPPFQEDDHGRCVQKQLSPSGKCTHPPPLCLHTYPAALEGSVPQDRPPPQFHTLTREVWAGVTMLPAHLLSLAVLSNSAGLIVVCTVAGISALIVAAICWCRLQKEIRLAQKAEYSAQRAASPLPYDKISPGDKTLAQSAQMYHYQHQKQQMLSLEKHKEEPKLPDPASSDEENEDGDFTVYECPGLAPTGEMEVRNPLFDDSSLHPSNPKSHQ